MALFTPDKVDAPSLHSLLSHELKDLYDAECQILDVLPKVIEQSTNPELRHALEEHKAETEMHVTRLEDAFNLLDIKPARETCDGMKGILKEGDHVLHGKMEAGVKDDALIAATERVEHYEMAGYSAAAIHAHVLGLEDVAELLEATLKEEQKAGKTLEMIMKNNHKMVSA